MFICCLASPLCPVISDNIGATGVLVKAGAKTEDSLTIARGMKYSGL